MWWRRAWFSLKGKAGIPGQTKGRPATSIGPRVLPLGSLQQRAERIKGMVAEVEPDLVIWKVGTTEVLARTDSEEFARSLDETVKWLKEHDIDVVLVDPQYTASLAGDPGYNRVVASVEAVARANAVPLVFRSKAVRYLTEQRSNAGQNPFQLNELGYRCIAEHVVRAVLLSIRQPGGTPSQEQTQQPK